MTLKQLIASRKITQVLDYEPIYRVKDENITPPPGWQMTPNIEGNKLYLVKAKTVPEAFQKLAMSQNGALDWACSKD